ncbi:TPA: helix-turn-helix domain-containing protein [Raoultella planticola]|uniref:helix-turn-helix domain-containing protein n=1 Tax=Raoultella planticola TaxID=575 RepID=UPI001A25E442|nr:helix-turn-helix domain-containing protein [Raoultella planticola]
MCDKCQVRMNSCGAYLQGNSQTIVIASANREQVLALRKEDLGASEIVRRLNIARSTVYKISGEV